MSDSRFRLFAPIMAGATLKDRLVGCLGAFLGVALATLLARLAVGPELNLPAIVAPMGASAVLLFAVPSSPMAQPWPIFGGNTISALVGVAVAQHVAFLPLAAALAVALAILLMSLTRSLHPPGGAAALTAVIGGPAIANMGFWYPLVPVAMDAALLLAAGYIFHRISGRPYPHRPVPASPHGTRDAPTQLRTSVTESDVDQALAAVGESFDIDREDLMRLLAEAEWRASVRTGGRVSCAEIMSRDVVGVAAAHTVGAARHLLMSHNIRTLPVTDADGHLLGTVGLRQLLGDDEAVVADVMVPATEVAPETRVAEFLPMLADGESHGAVVVDGQRKVLGVVTQTDVLAAMVRSGQSSR